MIDQIAAQADALVDIQYYMLNCAAKKGFNMSSIFGVVHAANMAKRDPQTGRFEKRADGKVIKPAGWKPPDVEGELGRQFAEGSWCSKEPRTPPCLFQSLKGLSPDEKVAEVRNPMTRTSQDLGKPEPAHDTLVMHGARVQ